MIRIITYIQSPIKYIEHKCIIALSRTPHLSRIFHFFFARVFLEKLKFYFLFYITIFIIGPVSIASDYLCLRLFLTLARENSLNKDLFFNEIKNLYHDGTLKRKSHLSRWSGDEKAIAGIMRNSMCVPALLLIFSKYL